MNISLRCQSSHNEGWIVAFNSEVLPERRKVDNEVFRKINPVPDDKALFLIQNYISVVSIFAYILFIFRCFPASTLGPVLTGFCSCEHCFSLHKEMVMQKQFEERLCILGSTNTVHFFV